MVKRVGKPARRANYRSRRKSLARKYTGRLGTRCFWQDGYLVYRGEHGLRTVPGVRRLQKEA